MKRATETALMQMLPDGRRLRLRNGPIDLIVEARGKPGEVSAAYRQAAAIFPDILGDLAGELPLLRAPVGSARPSGPIARKMHAAAVQMAPAFATPMICVAGAVADHVLAEMLRGRTLDRAYVNNGGDIALHLASGQAFDIGICADVAHGTIGSKVRITASDTIGGIATSGWQGRSHSLGIADAVTVLARDAAMADAAATLIANTVDLPGHRAIERAPANSLSPDSDLGERLVTTAVGRLSGAEVSRALASGRHCAQAMLNAGRIIAAHGSLQGQGFAVQNASATAPNVPLNGHVTRSELAAHA